MRSKVKLVKVHPTEKSFMEANIIYKRRTNICFDLSELSGTLLKRFREVLKNSR